MHFWWSTTDSLPFSRFSLLFSSSLCSPHRDFMPRGRLSRFLHCCMQPLSLNTFCTLVPLLVIFKTVYWTIVQIVAISRANKAHRHILVLASRAADEWALRSALPKDSSTFIQLENSVEHYSIVARRVLVNVRISGIQSNVAAFVVLMVRFQFTFFFVRGSYHKVSVTYVRKSTISSTSSPQELCSRFSDVHSRWLPESSASWHVGIEAINHTHPNQLQKTSRTLIKTS